MLRNGINSVSFSFLCLPHFLHLNLYTCSIGLRLPGIFLLLAWLELPQCFAAPQGYQQPYRYTPSSSSDATPRRHIRLHDQEPAWSCCHVAPRALPTELFHTDSVFLNVLREQSRESLLIHSAAAALKKIQHRNRKWMLSAAVPMETLFWGRNSAALFTPRSSFTQPLSHSAAHPVITVTTSPHPLLPHRPHPYTPPV